MEWEELAGPCWRVLFGVTTQVRTVSFIAEPKALPVHYLSPIPLPPSYLLFAEHSLCISSSFLRFTFPQFQFPSFSHLGALRRGRGWIPLLNKALDSPGNFLVRINFHFSFANT